VVSAQQRILIAHPSVDLYGSDRMLLRSASALRRNGGRVLVTVPIHGPLVDELVATGIRADACPAPVLRKGSRSFLGLLSLGWLSLASLPRQWRLLRTFRPDVVYVNTLTLPTWLLVGRLYGARVVCHVREAESDAGRTMRLALTAPLRLAHVVLCNSKATETFVVGGSGMLARRCRVIYNGLPIPEVVDPVARNRPVQRDPSLILVGRLSPRKGQDIAVRALALLRDRGLAADLHFFGDAYAGYAWYVDSLQDLAEDLQVAERVHFHGFVSSSPGAIYQSHDIALVPSRVEPFGNVAVEALGAGIPVVASAVQGLVEVLEQGGGVLVPPDDPPALATAIQGLLGLDQMRWQALVDQGRQQVTERFSLARYERELVSTMVARRPN
jgi:glycosyltransferase involved in cell wall biosynthesis